jgi:hypothetical protein
MEHSITSPFLLIEHSPTLLHHAFICFFDTKKLHNFFFIISHLTTARERALYLVYKHYQIVVSNSDTRGYSCERERTERETKRN